jgi:hypothetical protein
MKKAASIRAHDPERQCTAFKKERNLFRLGSQEFVEPSTPILSNLEDSIPAARRRHPNTSAKDARSCQLTDSPHAALNCHLPQIPQTPAGGKCNKKHYTHRRKRFNRIFPEFSKILASRPAQLL